MNLRHLFPIPREADGAAGGAPAAATLLGTPTPAAAPAGDAAPAAPADPRGWLPEEYRADPTFKDLGDPGMLAKAYKNAASMVGADRATLVKLPKEGDDAAWGDVWAKLGRPETADKYGFKADGMDDATVGAARETFHKLGLTERQAAGLMEFQGQITQQQTAALAEKGLTPERIEAFQQVTALTPDTVAADLKREWGAAFDDKLHAAKLALREVAPPEVAELMERTGLGNHPAMIKLFAAIGGGRAESTLKGGGTGGTGGSMTPAQAQAEIKVMQGDSEFARVLMDRDHPGYPAAKEKWDRVHSFASGGA